MVWLVYSARQTYRTRTPTPPPPLTPDTRHPHSHTTPTRHPHSHTTTTTTRPQIGYYWPRVFLANKDNFNNGFPFYVPGALARYAAGLMLAYQLYQGAK